VARRNPAPEEKAKSFGLTVQPVTKELAEQYGIEKVDGVLITEVERGSVAERRGIKPGDVVVEVNHKPVSSPKQFLQMLKAADMKKGVAVILSSRGTSKIEVLKDDDE
jgi:serine protease Do